MRVEIESNVGGEPLVYEQGANQIPPALEKALAGHTLTFDVKVLEIE